MPKSPTAPRRTPLLDLLGGAEALSRGLDRRQMYRTATEQATRFLGGSFGLMFAVGFHDALQVALLGCCVADGAAPQWDDAGDTIAWIEPDPLLARALSADHGHAMRRDGDHWRVAFAIGPLGEARWLLEVQGPRRPSASACAAISLFLRCFENQQHMWEYTNLDTLTKLLNRKTFDDDFERLIQAAEIAEQQLKKIEPGRRPLQERITQPCWLGVVDIDHFKKINDNFGHLFGDEVLLRIADLMRQSFRTHDKLFRFGGEEFVVMLRNVPEDNVQAIFDRFRTQVEAHEFPRVGRVACSIGYARIDPRLPPAELLGRADEALYYSKENGRNQANGYDMLVMSGRLRLTQPPGQDSVQADIDEFFL